LKAASGNATIVLRSPRGVVSQNAVRLDSAGAFFASLHVPSESVAGEYTIMATVNGAAAGTTVHVDANAGGLSLSLTPQCERTCDPNADVPVLVRASRDGVAAPNTNVKVAIIRSPHAYPADTADQPWGVAEWYSTSVRTGSDGRAVLMIPHPSDGLPSTYGVRADSGGATADTRIVVPSGSITLRVHLDDDDIGSGTPAFFDIYGVDVASGKPAEGVPVRVQLMHGSSAQEQSVTLDAHGHARGSFSRPQIGSSLVVASAGASMDATQLQVEPQTMQMQNAQGSQNIAIALDRKRYTAGEEAHVSASLSGARGSAVITLESATKTDVRIVPVRDGHAVTSFRIADTAGVLAVGAAFVRDGALQWESVPLVVDAPGRPLSVPLVLDKNAYAPGGTARVELGGVRPGGGTLIVRLTKGTPTGSAMFVNAPDLLAIGTTATQDTATDGASWHPWVDSTGEHAVVQTFVRRTAPPADLTMTQADTASVYWKVDRQAGDAIVLPVPDAPGKYVLTLLKIDDDGRVTAASSELVVQ
jgi:uncharacterized protein YfaS (alpha-2-macroglobulin family)